MSRDRDILLCRIAVTSGMVPAETAQKVLALCSERERTTGRRPRAVEVLVKNGVLNAAEAQKLNAAVAKRTGGASPAATRTRNVSAARSAPHARHRRGRPPMRRRRRRAAPLDRRTVVQGTLFAAVCLVVVGIIAYLFVVRSMESPGEGASESPRTAEVTGTIAPREDSGPSEVVRLTTTQLAELETRLNDVITDRIDNRGRAKRGIEALAKKIQTFEESGVRVPDDFRQRYENVAESLKSAAGESAGTDDARSSRENEGEVESDESLDEGPGLELLDDL